MENENQNSGAEEIVNEEGQSEGQENQEGSEEVNGNVKEDRPPENWKAEALRRKDSEEKLRRELDAERAKHVQRRDQNDIATWSDNELVAIKNSNDPQALAYKQQAEDVLLERKVERIRERERVNERRVKAEMELRMSYPEAIDSNSEFALKMDQVMYDLDLQKSPAGRLAAAKIVAAELQKGTAKTGADGRKRESDRVRDVKAQFVEGDRPKPLEGNKSPKKVEELENRIKDGDHRAVGEALKDRGIDVKSFFKR